MRGFVRTPHGALVDLDAFGGKTLLLNEERARGAAWVSGSRPLAFWASRAPYWGALVVFLLRRHARTLLQATV